MAATRIAKIESIYRDECKDKLKEIFDNYDQLQLITIANILSIDTGGSTEDITKHILIALADISAFKETIIAVSASYIKLDDSHNTVDRGYFGPCGVTLAQPIKKDFILCIEQTVQDNSEFLPFKYILDPTKGI